MMINVGCRVRYQVREPTTFVFAIQTIDGGDQRIVSEELSLPPAFPADFFLDPEGNRLIRFAAPEGILDVGYHATLLPNAETLAPTSSGQNSINCLPPMVMPYLKPSRYCPADELGDLAEELFAAHEDDYAKAQAIEAWLHDTLSYQAGASSRSTTAIDTLRARAGVCRDFAHLGIAFARALSLPARFVSCYAPGLSPPDFHAVFEVYCGQSWRRFDATRLVRLDDVIPIAIGRDAADTPFATAFGLADLVECSVYAHAQTASDVRARTIPRFQRPQSAQ